MKTLIVAMVVVLTFAARAEQLHYQPSTNAPATDFETFNLTKDAVLLRGITGVGELDNLNNQPVEVRAEELVNVLNSNKVYAVAVRTRVGGNTVVNYIDYDELGGLIQGLQFITESDHYVTHMDDFDASIHTRGGLTVSKYSSGNRNVAAIKTGVPGIEPNIMDVSGVATLRNLIITAKAKLDALKQANQ